MTLGGAVAHAAALVLALGQKEEDGIRFATGIRQMPAIAWHGGALYVVMNNRDQLDTLWPGMFTAKENAERPAEPSIV